ncbi:MAG: lipoprotein-releasing ABC transporter ATP-binding protein LolD [Pseudomonadales bacterium]|nr:lipoprotein-releasing ABC transporter ATP-binding protein LolD [Pseudomonadales bacterium]
MQTSEKIPRSQATTQLVLECRHLAKTYHQGPQPVEVLQDINLEVHSAERIGIIGSSGSGKTTLLNLLGGLDLPTAGDVYIAGRKLSRLDETERGHLRNRYLGFVYQFHHLLGEFTALENVCMPLLIAGEEVMAASHKAEKLLQRIGLGQRLQHKPAELSGGERQRVAIARALVNDPHCVLMDEPTGNLDRATALEIHALIAELNADLATSFIVVTHDEVFASSLDRVLRLHDGCLQLVKD